MENEGSTSRNGSASSIKTRIAEIFPLLPSYSLLMIKPERGAQTISKKEKQRRHTPTNHKQYLKRVFVISKTYEDASDLSLDSKRCSKKFILGKMTN